MHINNVTSLNVATKIRFEYFDVHNNKLTSLEGAPKEIGGKLLYENKNRVTNRTQHPLRILLYIQLELTSLIYL
jgi:hypothetical protein